MKKIRVLCAMRDPWAAQALRREIDDGERFALETVRSGDGAMRAALKSAPHILVLDAVLPGVDGLGVLQRLRAALGERMPKVIAGSTMGFATQGLLSRGADAIVRVPWEREELRGALLALADAIRARVDWERAQGDYAAACALLDELGMRGKLRGYAYLAWAAALVREDEDRLFAIGQRLYAPIASRFDTTPQSVERLIRHAVESAMDAVGAQGVYGFFGNTIDPTRGKPTNAQMIGLLAQRLRVS